MCWVEIALAATSSMIKGAAQVKAGEEENRQALATAQDVEIDNRIATVEAKQQSRDMQKQFMLDTNTNRAFFSYMGIEGSESIKAFETAQEASILETESRMQNQSKLRDARSKSEIANLKLSGKNALSASYLNALSTGIEATTTIQSVYGDYKKPKKTS